MKTPAVIIAVICCITLMMSVLMPFYVQAVETDILQRNDFDESLVCGSEGENMMLVRMSEASETECAEKPVCVELYHMGTEKLYLTDESDCGSFLDNAGIDLEHCDIVNLDSDTLLDEKAHISVDRVEYKTEIRTEVVPFGTVENGIDTIPKGTREIVSQGKNGSATRTYLVKYVNGKKAEEAVYTENILVKPVDELVNVGVGGTVTAKDGTVYHYSYRKQMEATAYTYLPPYTTMTTATGQTLRKGIVAVDPKVIPLHTKMFITGSVEYGYGIAEDTGGAIKGNIVDLAYMSYDECIQFGRRQMQVYILE